MKLRRIIPSLTFALILAGGAIAALVIPHPEFSNIESRDLALPPKFVADGKINPSFFAELTTYYTDAFPLREQFVKASRRVNKAYEYTPIKDSISGVIFIDRIEHRPQDAATDDDIDDYVEPPTGSDTTLPAATYTPPPEPNVDKMSSRAIVGDRAFELYKYEPYRTAKFAENANKVAEIAGIPTYVVIPPTASELYLPQNIRDKENNQAQMYEYLGTAIDKAVFIDLREEYERDKDKYIYFRSDHHWTADGAYLAYAGFMRATGAAPTLRTTLTSGIRYGFLGSLYRAIADMPASELMENNPDYVRFYYPKHESSVISYKNEEMRGGTEMQLVNPEFNKTTNLYEIFLGGDSPLLHIQNPPDDTNGKTLIIIRDSYGHAFLPFIANDYTDIYVLEPRYFTSFDLSALIKNVNADELLLLNYAFPATSDYWQDWNTELEKFR